MNVIKFVIGLLLIFLACDGFSIWVSWIFNSERGLRYCIIYGTRLLVSIFSMLGTIMFAMWLMGLLR